MSKDLEPLKHTPGPWKATHPAQLVWEIRTQEGSLLAVYYGANSDDNPNNAANARLIANAPVLLAALRAAVLYVPEDIRKELQEVLNETIDGK